MDTYDDLHDIDRQRAFVHWEHTQSIHFAAGHREDLTTQEAAKAVSLIQESETYQPFLVAKVKFEQIKKELSSYANTNRVVQSFVDAEIAHRKTEKEICDEIIKERQ